MDVGLLIPQGYFGEFDGWEPTTAWNRMVAIAMEGRRRGFRSIWIGEHVLSKWDPHAIAFDCMTLAPALLSRVPDVDLGFVVVNSTFRHPYMTAKSAGTLDAISGGRVILGLGAGFKPTEADAVGVPFPGTKARLAMLEEHLTVIAHLTRRAHEPLTWTGQQGWVRDAMNAPATSGRDHIPLLIGGHGPNVTFRLAARFCDEINIDQMPAEIPASRSLLAERCLEVGRDPATLRIAAGINPAWPYAGLRVKGRQRLMKQQDVPAIMSMATAGTGRRVEELDAWREVGINRLVVGGPGMADTDEAIDELVEDLTEAGIPLHPPATDSALEAP